MLLLLTVFNHGLAIRINAFLARLGLKKTAVIFCEFSSIATFGGAIADIVPHLFPFLTPTEGAHADGAGLLREVSFFHVA